MGSTPACNSQSLPDPPPRGPVAPVHEFPAAAPRAPLEAAAGPSTPSRRLPPATPVPRPSDAPTRVVAVLGQSVPPAPAVPCQRRATTPRPSRFPSSSRVPRPATPAAAPALAPVHEVPAAVVEEPATPAPRMPPPPAPLPLLEALQPVAQRLFAVQGYLHDALPEQSPNRGRPRSLRPTSLDAARVHHALQEQPATTRPVLDSGPGPRPHSP